jgi:hypothetical protein
MNNWQFPFLLYASRIFPDKKDGIYSGKKVVTGSILVVICGESCIGNMTHNVYVKGSKT